ncbi:MAG TPA: SOS response-associated peptidase family protein [Caulobacterales bacterium]|nr:SOS response-associated peptidase family protein [Caulobacterales bacterium]
MCNLYRNDIRKAGRERAYYGYEEFSETPQEIYPDVLAPVIGVRQDGSLGWTSMRWGFPPPEKLARRLVTNVRNLDSPYWRGWLEPRYRCLVPFDRFCEWSDATPKRQAWFALPEERMGFFAGIWRPWSGVRGTKAAPVEGKHFVFAILTCEANGVVRPVHAKAMPVILGGAAQQDAWLHAPAQAVLTLAQPLPETEMRVLAA